MKRVLVNVGDILHIAWWISWRTAVLLAAIVALTWVAA